MKLSALAIVAILGAGTASATTITIGAAPDTASLMPVADTTTGTVFENVTGSITNVRLSAWHQCGCAVDEDATDAFYTSVSGSASATYDFDAPSSSLSFLWGSPDVWNDLDITLTGGAGVVTINGLDVQGTPGVAAQFVTISDVGLFDSVTFRSSVNAFEYAALSAQPAAIPLPATAPLVLLGVAGLGFAARRRRGYK